MTIHIRKASLDEYNAVVSIQVDAVRRQGETYKSPILDKQVFEDCMNEGNVWVAVMPEGYLGGYAVTCKKREDVYLDHLCARTDLAGQKVGHCLLEHVLKLAKQEGRRAVTLITSASVPWNGPYYERRGFVRLEEGMPDYLENLLEKDIRAHEAEAEKVPQIMPRIAMEKRLDSTLSIG